MIKIEQKENLEISSESRKILSPIIKNWLTKNQFRLDVDNKKYVFDGVVDNSFLKNVYDYLNAYEKNILLDSHCSSVLSIVENQRLDYEIAVKRALEIKHNAKTIEPFLVPRMQSGIDLKWYQRVSVQHAVTLGNSANFSVPGSGKTWMAYATFFILKQRKTINKLLVVAPSAAFKPWENEYKAMTGQEGNIMRLTGNRDEREFKFRYPKDHEIFLVNYAIAGIDNTFVLDLLKHDDFLLIVDESHHIKNPSAQRTDKILQLGNHAKRKIILTGTMMPKELLDVWTQFQFLYPETNASLLGSYNSFKTKSKENNAIKKYSKILSPYFTRVSKNMLDLPEPSFNPTNNGKPHIVPMGYIQRRIYDAIRGRIKDNAATFGEDSISLHDYIKKAIIYLIEISVDPALIKHNTQFDTNELDALNMSALEMLEQYPRLKDEPHSKYKKAVSLAEETLKKNDKVIVWTNFITSLKKLQKYFEKAGYKSIVIYSAIPKDDEQNANLNREREIEKFKTSDYNVLIAIPASLAESVSLHKECHHAIYVDRTFNGGHYIQSLERIHRVGLDKNTETRYDIIQSEDCIDQTIDYVLDLRKKNMENFFNSSELYVNDFEYADPSNYSNAVGNEKDFQNDLKHILGHIKH